MVTEQVTPAMLFPSVSEASFTTQWKSEVASAPAPGQFWKVTVKRRPGVIPDSVTTPSIRP